MRSKLSKKEVLLLLPTVYTTPFLFMLKIYAFVGVFIAITALKGNKEFPNLLFEYLFSFSFLNQLFRSG